MTGKKRPKVKSTALKKKPALKSKKRPMRSVVQAPVGWQRLRPGDIVDVVAPGSRPLDMEHYEKGLVILRSLGLKVRVPKDIFGGDVLCANSDQARAKHLIHALTNRESKAVWCARGGYGSNRLIPELLKVARPKTAPKLFVGISDVSSIHLFLNQVWKWPTLHASLIDRLGSGKLPDEIMQFLFELVMEFDESKLILDDDIDSGAAAMRTEVESDAIEYCNLQVLNPKKVKAVKSVSGVMAGGNLMTVSSHLGSNLSLEGTNQILFFEELAERAYRIDRMLESLRQAGVFENAKAIVFGEFLNCEEPNGKNLVPDVLRRFADQLSIPVLIGMPAGHGVNQNPVPLGVRASIELFGDSGNLAMLTGAGQASL